MAGSGKRKMRLIAERRADLDARIPRWAALTLHQALDDAAARFAARPFVITEARQWTYADIVSWSKRLAEGLKRSGVASNDKVAIILANYPEFVALKYAISRLGAVAVPLNFLNRRDELRYLLDQSDAVLLVTMDCFRGNDFLSALDEIAPSWEQEGGGTALPKLRNILLFPTGEIELRVGTTLFESLDDGTEAADVAVDPSAVSDIIYTSGTTGPPKGVMLTHDMLTRTAFGGAYSRAFEDGQRVIFALPMFHVYGYVEGMLAVPWVGGAIIPQLRFEAEVMLRAIERHRATDALLIPAMTLALIDEARAGNYDLSSFHFAISSGARAPERVWRDIKDVLGVSEITTGYGMSETTATTMLTSPDDPFERLLTTNGRLRDVGPAGDPALGGKLVVYHAVDERTGEPVPAGEIGELVARGPGVTKGYYNKPDATAAAFDRDGWLRTGDLGRFDADGYLSLVGRSKESYRCGGEQVLPTEIEDLFTTLPDILQAQVVPIPDERMGEVGVAFIVPAPGRSVDLEALRALATDRLARFKVPRHFLIVDESVIPTTASGRARKFLLAELAVQMLGLS